MEANKRVALFALCLGVLFSVVAAEDAVSSRRLSCGPCGSGCVKGKCVCGWCKQCKPWYELVGGKCKKKCKVCHPYCAKCDCHAGCLACHPNYKLVDGKCVECPKCDEHCKTCICGWCKVCEDGYILKDGKCVEDCKGCGHHCHTCHCNKCDTCWAGYSWKDGACKLKSSAIAKATATCDGHPCKTFTDAKAKITKTGTNAKAVAVAEG